jgi:hypothetical protein
MGLFRYPFFKGNETVDDPAGIVTSPGATACRGPEKMNLAISGIVVTPTG